MTRASPVYSPNSYQFGLVPVVAVSHSTLHLISDTEKELYYKQRKLTQLAQNAENYEIKSALRFFR